MYTYIKKGKSKISISTFLLLTIVCLQPLKAQNTDYMRMEENLKMMKKVLSEVFRSGNPNTDLLQVRSRNTDAQYIQGFGIVMHTPLFYRNGRNAITLSGRAQSGQNVIVWPDRDRVLEDAAPKADSDEDEELEEERGISQDEIDQKKIELMTYFLMNYGDLANELPKDEKILLVYGHNGNESSNNYQVPAIWGEKQAPEKKGPGTITVTVDKKDVDRFRQKELSEEGFKKALQVSNLQPNNKKRMAYHILGQILQDVVAEHSLGGHSHWDSRNNMQAQYRIATNLGAKPKISYEILAGYGAVYQIQNRSSILGVYGRSRKGKSRVYIDGNQESSASLDKRIDSSYQEMVPEVQKAIIEYGRTLRDLGKDEWLSVKIEIPACENCESPAVVEMNVPQKVLEDYDSRSISLDTAVGRMEVRGKGQAKNKSERGNYIYFGNGQHDE